MIIPLSQSYLLSHEKTIWFALMITRIIKFQQLFPLLQLLLSLDGGYINKILSFFNLEFWYIFSKLIRVRSLLVNIRCLWTRKFLTCTLNKNLALILTQIFIFMWLQFIVINFKKTFSITINSTAALY